MTKLQRTCASCLFFEHTAHPEDGKVHAALGHKPYGKACMSYEPNPFDLKPALSEIEILARTLNKLGPSAKEALGNIIVSSGRLNKYGFRFMQKVAYQWRGGSHGQYLNNYAYCYVLGISKDGQELRLVSQDRKIGIQCPTSSVVKLDAFQKLREELIEQRRIKDPHIRKGSNITNQPSVPHIDSLTEIMADFLPKLNFLSKAERAKVKELKARREGNPADDRASFDLSKGRVRK